MSNSNSSVSLSAVCVLSPVEQHCVLRLIAQLDDEQLLALNLNRTETAVLQDLYVRMAGAGVGGHADGLTPEYYGPAAAAEQPA